MFTQCPECHAYFQITPQQLKQGEGEVRCGQCLAVFNAVQHLTDSLPAVVTEDVAVYARWAAQATRAEQKPAATAELDSEAATQPASGDTAPEPEPEAIPPQESAEESPDAVEIRPEAEPVAHEVDPAEETPLPQEPEPEAILPEESIGESPEADEIGPEEAEPVAHEAEAIEDTADQQATPTEEPLTAKAEAEDMPPKPQIPEALRRQLQDEKEARLRPPRTRWVVGSLILLLGLGGQAVYFMRNELAADPQLRPWLEQACALAGCEINLPRPPAHIEILGWDVRSHPNAPNALLANATLINNDPEPQPYPLLWLKFTDINGQPVAQRRFRPEEYLPQDTDQTAGMPPQTPVVVELALQDPGKGAVNFEFQTEPLYLSRK